MIVSGQTEARTQLSSTIIDYHGPFDQGFRGQTHDWRYQYKVFSPLCFKMAERFENLDKILLAWAKEKILKSLVDALNR